MNYELCKELKDAGFPQEFSDEYREDLQYEFYCKDPDYGSFIIWISSKEYRTKTFERTPIKWEIEYKVPTLSELIEAVKKREEGLILEDIGTKWVASVSGRGNRFNQIENTPEEAVARLWLELHKQQ